MTAAAKRLLEEALQLPPKERADLAHRLWESLDDEPDEDPAEVERAWQVEIERRVKEIEAGTADLVDGETVLRELRAKYPPRG